MASTIVLPTLAQMGNYAPQIAQKLVDVATQAQADVNALQQGGVAGTAPIHLARGATTAALAANTYAAAGQTLTGNANGSINPIDGVTLAVGDRLFVKNEGSANGGIYVVTVVGTAGTKFVLTRAADMSGSADFQNGMLIGVQEGSVNGGLYFQQSNTGAFTLDTTTPSWNSFADPSVTATQPDLFVPAVGSLLTYARADHAHPLQGIARAVVTANVASLAAFVGVTGGSSTDSDGVLAIAGDIVLLTAQTTPAQNGPYVVGTVAAGAAPLTRPIWFAAASTQRGGGTKIRVGGEGTVYKNTEWNSFISATNTYVVDTTDGKFYPLQVSWTCALVAGNLVAGVGATAGAPPTMAVFSVDSNIVAVRKTANTSSLTTGGYHPIIAPTAGPPGTGAYVVQAAVAAGSINVADISTLICTLINQAA